MTTCLEKSCSFGLPRVPFVNCFQFMYLVISLLVLRAGCGIWDMMWDLDVSVLDHCLSFYLALFVGKRVCFGLFCMHKVQMIAHLGSVASRYCSCHCKEHRDKKWDRWEYKGTNKRFEIYLSQLMRLWYSTYYIGDQRRLRRACGSTQSRQSFAVRTYEVWK